MFTTKPEAGEKITKLFSIRCRRRYLTEERVQAG